MFADLARERHPEQRSRQQRHDQVAAERVPEHDVLGMSENVHDKEQHAPGRHAGGQQGQQLEGRQFEEVHVGRGRADLPPWALPGLYVFGRARIP